MFHTSAVYWPSIRNISKQGCLECWECKSPSLLPSWAACSLPASQLLNYSLVSTFIFNQWKWRWATPVCHALHSVQIACGGAAFFSHNQILVFTIFIIWLYKRNLLTALLMKKPGHSRIDMKTPTFSAPWHHSGLNVAWRHMHEHKTPQPPQALFS